MNNAVGPMKIRQ